MALISVCDECGKPATWHMYGSTGRVLIDGVDNNTQSCDLCSEHAPLEPPTVHHQPNNCRRVKFYWPGMPEWNK